MESQPNETEQAPAEPTRQQRYVALCAQLGERQFLIAKLSRECAAIAEAISKLDAPTPEAPPQ